MIAVEALLPAVAGTPPRPIRDELDQRELLPDRPPEPVATIASIIDMCVCQAYHSSHTLGLISVSISQAQFPRVKEKPRAGGECYLTRRLVHGCAVKQAP